MNHEFTIDEVERVAKDLNVTFEGFTLEQVRVGMNVELEHGSRYPDLNVTGDDPITTCKIALAHLREFPDYYDRLAKMELEADAIRKDRVQSEKAL